VYGVTRCGKCTCLLINLLLKTNKMKRLFVKLALCACLLSPFVSAATGNWKQVTINDVPQKIQLMHPRNFLVYTMNESEVKMQLWNLSVNPEEGMVLTLPLPDGSTRDFKVWQTPVMPDDLAAQYPDIKTFTGEAIGNRNITAKIDFTLFGLHAMIFNGEQTSFVDPYDAYHDGFYMVHYKRDEVRAISDRMVCAVHGNNDIQAGGTPMVTDQTTLPGLAHKTVNGAQLRTYRLALSADNFYCAAAPAATTVAAALSKMTTSVNRINGVYERELSITLVFVSTENLIIYPTATGSSNGPDPFNLIDNNPGACLDSNQKVCDRRIGTANYDIGHVFTTGGGGLSSLGCVCNSFFKAQSVTGSGAPVGDGFDIDYVAHEMGHEFGGEHPFNNPTDGSCGGGNRNAATSYEPGSGSTIMAYAGICGPTDDLQFHSDPYFHAVSLNQMQAYVNGGGSCATLTATGNKLVGYSAFAATYSITYLTPFELTGPALTDSVADSAVLYCWEEYDNDPGGGSKFAVTTSIGPLFRSYNPVTSNTRVFPKVSMVLAATLSNAGAEGATGEKVPTVARSMQFACTFRDIFHNKGCFTFPDDMITLNAVTTPTSAGFKVTSQSTAGITFNGGDAATVTWDVVGTNAAPVSAATVDIYLSLNCGNNYFVGNFPNTGTAGITVPNPAATNTAYRFKVKGHGNVFFNVNGKNFKVTTNSSIPVAPNSIQSVTHTANNINVYPVPATDLLHIVSDNDVDAIIVNTLGQKVWEGRVSTKADLSVASWAKGIYYIRFADIANGAQSVRSVIIE
jgi:hypothetical protein